MPPPPENIHHRPYDSTEQYLRTQFSLLRADCMLPVRDAVRSFRAGAVEDNEMVVYVKVRPKGVLFSNFGVVHRMSFVVDGRKVNWKQSKRLIPGSLVCLSTDNFEHFRFATVVERDLDHLQNPRDLRIGIKFLDQNPMQDFDRDICYTMVESMRGYYEAYKHVLKCLQDINPDTLPFQPQLVGLDPDLQQPEYSEGIDSIRDREFIAQSVLEFPAVLKGEYPTEVGGSEEVRPNVVDAVERMLTKELAVVQGPPGTGKTFLGLLSTYILLNKCRTAATGPIIVICQTNHALDQFLEGVLKFEDRIIRLGSRSKNPLVMDKTLYKVRQWYKEHQDYARNDKVRLVGPGRLYKRKEKIQGEMLELLDELSQEYVPLLRLQELNIISQAQLDSFANDGWVTRDNLNQAENPTAESWLKAAPRLQDPEAISFLDDELLKDDFIEEIDEEELEDRVEEFMTGNIDEGKIMGESIEVRESIVSGVKDDLVGNIEDFMRTPNVHEIPVSKRLNVYKRWLRQYQKHIFARLGELQNVFNLVCEVIRAELRRNDESILKTTRVIGMTTTAASKYHDLLCMLKPKIMLCEEASETLEAHLLCALTPSVQHFILIGDHEQLRPSVAVNDLTFKGLDISLFERFVKNEFPFTILDCQRRMRPHIRSLIQPIYPKLTDHESVYKYENVRGMMDNLWFLTHDEQDALGTNNSHINPHEVAIATRLAIYLLHQGYPPSQITILAMYSGQRNEIQKKLKRSGEEGAEMIRVSTVDGFQGEENEIIILSLVRSNANNSIGFLRTSNRICVGLSRAKKGLYILGNAKLLMDKSKLWDKIIGILAMGLGNCQIGNRIRLQCSNHPDVISEVGLEAEFDQVEQGGCSEPCGGRFPRCGHPCYYKCHVRDHEDMTCNHPCGKRLHCGSHFCDASCGVVCKPCKICRP
ncbi:P-loop containing nucleoside triphosphate hydrolase protein [Mortierella sp. GBAus27b]|nr:P-loop containing nucleoside triphosphate hydrolase protein [Mortierella sp. GBAus27b]